MLKIEQEERSMPANSPIYTYYYKFDYDDDNGSDAKLLSSIKQLGIKTNLADSKKIIIAINILVDACDESNSFLCDNVQSECFTKPQSNIVRTENRINDLARRTELTDDDMQELWNIFINLEYNRSLLFKGDVKSAQTVSDIYNML
jgi:hypothetical protein